MKNTELLEKLRFLNIKEVSLTFSGSGDSGEWNSVDFFDANNNPVSCDPDTEDYIERFAEDRTSESGIDWWNNEGGGGSFTIHVDTGMAYLEIYQNEEAHRQCKPIIVTKENCLQKWEDDLNKLTNKPVRFMGRTNSDFSVNDWATVPIVGMNVKEIDDIILPVIHDIENENERVLADESEVSDDDYYNDWYSMDFTIDFNEDKTVRVELNIEESYTVQGYRENYEWNLNEDEDEY